MSSGATATFIETQEYGRFREFCDACRTYRYIGLCYGSPGVGKTLSARHYTRRDAVERCTLYANDLRPMPQEILGSRLVFYTPKVVNSPGQIERDVASLWAQLRYLIKADLLRRRDLLMKDATVDEVVRSIAEECCKIEDPTALIVIDEADRLKMAGLEQLRDIFDKGDVGMVFIGMPGLEKRLARYPQLYWRVGFVHEFRSLAEKEVRGLLSQGWGPPGVVLPGDWVSDEDAVAAILRITDGNFRLLERLLTQIARVLEVNNLQRVTPAVVEVARESLVIGTE